MSLSEIRVPSAKLIPINTFYVYSLDAATLTADDVVLDSLEVLGDLKVDGKTELVGDAKVDGVMVGAVALSTNKAISFYATPNTYPTGNTFALSAGTVAPAANRVVTFKDPLQASRLVLTTNNVVAQSGPPTVINAPSATFVSDPFITAAQAVTSVAISNSTVAADSVILVSIKSYNGTYGTNGFPVISVGSVTSGAFNLIVANVHPTNALAGSLSISILVC